MSFRNCWLSYEEWNLLCDELKDEKYHDFLLKKSELDDWKEMMEISDHYNTHKFARAASLYLLPKIKNPRVYNAICREHWREGETRFILEDIHKFIGFIINYDEDNCHDNVTLDEWEIRRNKVSEFIMNSDRKVFFVHDIMKVFYQECMPKVLVAHNITKTD